MMAGDPTIEPELFAAARDVQQRAHVPYSRFPVGAALRTPSGDVFVGCNVENAAYPEGTCAEAGAIAAMAAAGERVIDARAKRSARVAAGVGRRSASSPPPTP